MAQTEELERRIASALGRIGAAALALAEAPPQVVETIVETVVERVVEVPAPAPEVDADSVAGAEIARLRAELDAQASLNAQLDDRVRLIRERQDATVATLETRIGSLTAQLDAQGNEVQRLRMVNVQLREAMRGLREALTEGMADPGAINRAMLAELEALRATRMAEMAEMDEILAALDPLVAAAEAEGGAQDARA
jgi:hypothetical protein